VRYSSLSSPIIDEKFSSKVDGVAGRFPLGAILRTDIIVEEYPT